MEALLRSSEVIFDGDTPTAIAPHRQSSGNPSREMTG